MEPVAARQPDRAQLVKHDLNADYGFQKRGEGYGSISCSHAFRFFPTRKLQVLASELCPSRVAVPDKLAMARMLRTIAVKHGYGITMCRSGLGIPVGRLSLSTFPFRFFCVRRKTLKTGALRRHQWVKSPGCRFFQASQGKNNIVSGLFGASKRFSPRFTI